MEPGGKVVSEWCSLDMDEGQVVSQIAFNAGYYGPEWILIEDIPHQMRFDTVTKATARMQGRIIDRLAGPQTFGQGSCAPAMLDRVLFVPPATWQRHKPWAKTVWRQGEKGAAAAALELGYEPPNLLEIHKSRYVELAGKERQDVRNALKKLMTDFVDAYLIGRWAYDMLEKYDDLGEVPTVQRYTR